MVRKIALVLAVLAGLAVAVLLASDVSASYAGERLSCATVINAAATDPQPPDGSVGSAAGRARQGACHGALVRRTELTGLPLLVCLVAGTAVAAGLREDDEASTPALVSRPHLG
jgi:hypothetical protein